MTGAAPRIALVAGEISGDRLGAGLIRAFRKLHPEAQCIGVGGAEMCAEGLEPIADFGALQMNGLRDPIVNLPNLYRLFRQISGHLERWRPDAFVGIDFNVFNSLLERRMHARGIPVAHYVSPSVYAWRQGRARALSRYTDLLLTLFPFEAGYYQGMPLEVVHVGHPLAESLADPESRESARGRLGIDRTAQVITVLPGSRRGELARMLEPFLAGAAQLSPDRILVAVPDEGAHAQIERLACELQVHVERVDSAVTAICAADGVIAKSGTVTLEALLIGRPMVIAYRADRLSELAFRWLAATPYIGLPNILANEALVPELLQNDVTPEALANALRDQMQHFDIRGTGARFAALGRLLRGPDAGTGATAALALQRLVRSGA